MDGQDEGGCGWFRMESDLAPNPVPAPHKLCDLGQIGAFLNCVRYCHTSESRGVIDSTLMWYWLCYKTLLSTQSSQQPYKEVLLKFPFHRWASWVLRMLANVPKVTQPMNGRTRIGNKVVLLRSRCSHRGAERACWRITWCFQSTQRIARGQLLLFPLLEAHKHQTDSRWDVMDSPLILQGEWQRGWGSRGLWETHQRRLVEPSPSPITVSTTHHHLAPRVHSLDMVKDLRETIK